MSVTSPSLTKITSGGAEVTKITSGMVDAGFSLALPSLHPSTFLENVFHTFHYCVHPTPHKGLQSYCQS